MSEKKQTVELRNKQGQTICDFSMGFGKKLVERLTNAGALVYDVKRLKTAKGTKEFEVWTVTVPYQITHYGITIWLVEGHYLKVV